VPRRRMPVVVRLTGALLLLLASLPFASAVNATESETISAKALTSHSCDDSEWHFVITSVTDEQAAPGSITVSWTDGSTATVALEKVTGGTAHYRTTAHLTSTVSAATAEIYAGWTGEFNLSHGPCGSGEGDGGGTAGDGSGTSTVAVSAPTVADDCAHQAAVVSVTAAAHVTFRLNGAIVAAGDHAVAADASGDYRAVVTAEADDGYTIDGKDRWDLSGTLGCSSGGTGGTGGTTTIMAHALTDHECNTSEWHFVITGLSSDAQAPDSITVTFTGGVVVVVDLDVVTGGTAHYRTTQHLDLAVTAASADISGEWSGQFNLSHGPCGTGGGGGGGDTVVTAVAPTVDEDCESDSVIVTIPTTAHVSYRLNGSPVAAGAHPVAADTDGDYAVTVTATAASGFSLDGASTFTFTGTVSCGTTSPGTTAVTVSQAACASTGSATALVHIAAPAGSTPATYSVTRSVAGAAATAAGSVTLPAGGTTQADVHVTLVEDSAVRIMSTESDTGVLGTKSGRETGSGGSTGVLAATGQQLSAPLLLGIAVLLLGAGTLLLSAPRRVLTGLVGHPQGRHHRS
jgi:hypothetical protein